MKEFKATWKRSGESELKQHKASMQFMGLLFPQLFNIIVILSLYIYHLSRLMKRMVQY